MIKDRDGYITLSDEMYKSLSETDPSLPQSASDLFKIGKTKQGWDSDLFLDQMKIAKWVAEEKYPPCVFKHVWIFDHFYGHTAYAANALVVSRLNKKPGGK